MPAETPAEKAKREAAEQEKARKDQIAAQEAAKTPEQKTAENAAGAAQIQENLANLNKQAEEAAKTKEEDASVETEAAQNAAAAYPMANMDDVEVNKGGAYKVGFGRLGDYTEGQAVDVNKLYLGNTDEEKDVAFRRLVALGVLVEDKDNTGVKVSEILNAAGEQIIIGGESLAPNDTRLSTGGPHSLLLEQENIDAIQRAKVATAALEAGERVAGVTSVDERPIQRPLTGV